jgi:hypothetical protein
MRGLSDGEFRAPPVASIDYVTLALPAVSTDAGAAAAAALRAEIDVCDDLYATRPGGFERQDQAPGAISGDIAAELARLDAGEISFGLTRNGGAVTLAVMLCERRIALPEDGPEGLTETVYAFDYQGVRVIVLNSQRDDMLAEQAAWLEARLKDNRNRWTVVAFHHPVFSLATTRDNPRLRDAWKPLFDAYGVDLVLQGHDHTYGRGQNLAEGTSHRGDGGPVYVVSVSGPKMYDVGQHRDWATRRGANLQLYQIIAVSSQTLRYEARTVTGELFDAFEIAKDRRGRRTFSDHTPSVPPSR